MSEFENKNVIVTGGTGALGSAVVGRLLELGADVWVSCFDQRELKRFPHTDNEKAHVVCGVDLTDEASCQSFFAKPTSLWASIHIAGGFAMAPIEETSADDWRRMIELNATTCFLCCKYAVGRLKQSGGRIVNVAAKPAVAPVGGMVAYSASKAAVASITQSLAQEVQDDGVWVNAVVPSIMNTYANRAAMPGADHSRWPTVEEVAETIVFLASQRNALTHGALVPVFGKS